MIVVACSGFPVPKSRYFREFEAVEISDTELGIPSAGTRRHWLREASPGFAFSVLAPKQITAESFTLSADHKRAIEEVATFAKQMKSLAVVFAANPEWGPSRQNRTRLREFAEHVLGVVKTPVLDLPGWPLGEAEAALKKLPVTLAFDPLLEQPAHNGELAYARLPGPAGYRSRYDNDTLERVITFCKGSQAKQLFLVFRNIDRFENGLYVSKRLRVA